MQSTFSLSLFLVLCGDVGDRLIVHLLSFLPRGCNSPVSGSVGKASEKKKCLTLVAFIQRKMPETFRGLPR